MIEIKLFLHAPVYFWVTFSGASGTLNTGSGTITGIINARSDPEG